MKKNITGFAILLMIALAACAQQKTTTASSTVSNSKQSKGYTYLKMHRTACFGKCPSYAIELNSNGTVAYTGYGDVKYIGTYTRQMNESKVNALLDEAYKYRIDTCQENYRLMIADIPGINYEYTYKGEKHQIRHAHFGPDFLQKLAKDIDSEIGEPGSGWIRKEEKPTE